ncbi:hypothetical protein ABT186_24780 [Streptomyces sp. NPDC001634]|uniref:hypothetical protein n=1 Tax=Streptomyces sp. NPDC001634 TaxID=3154390 RepID=UPI0033234A0D
MSAGPWGTPAGPTGADGQQILGDVKVAGDGTASALWRDQAAEATTWDFVIAVKPAGGDTWGAPHSVATGRGETAEAPVLAVACGGQAVVSWLDGTDGTPADLAITWDPAQRSWSAPPAGDVRRSVDVRAPPGSGGRRHLHRRADPDRRGPEATGDDRHARPGRGPGPRPSPWAPPPAASYTTSRSPCPPTARPRSTPPPPP